MRAVNFQAPIRLGSPLNKGLLRWWRAEPNRNHSPRLRDLTSKSPVTLTGALRLGQMGLAGAAGTSVFDGVNDYGQTAAIDLSGISTMTVAVWMYWAYANDGDFLIETSSNFNNNDAAIVIGPNAGTNAIDLGIRTGAGTFNYSRLSRPSTAAWHHYAFCFDRGGGATQIPAVYIDGVSQSLTPVLNNTTGTGGFGNYVWNFMSRNGASAFGNGRIDDVRVYSRVLRAWEPRALMNASLRGYPRELRWSRGAEFGGYVEPVSEETEVQTFSVGGAGPLGSEEIPNTVLASATSLTPPAGTKYATIQAVGANFNFFLSGDTPTTGTTGDGRKLYNYGMIELDSGFTSAKFIREGNTANSKLVVEYFSRKLEE